MTERKPRTSPDEVLLGQRFHRLTVIGIYVKGLDGAYFPCMCECGRPVFVKWSRLQAGQQSCGCAEGHQVHRGSSDPLYRVWTNMRSRCLQPNNRAWKHYGGRGITIAWTSFTEFREWALSAGYETGLQLDRVDNDGPYSAENCRWATHQQQARNRRSNLLYMLDGEVRVLTAWAEDPRCVVSYSTLYARMRRGWSLAEAMTSPPGTREGGDSAK